MSLQPPAPAPAPASGACVNNNEKLFFFYFHNSYTRNGDHLIFLIKTGNAHEERTLLQAIIDTLKECEGEF